MLRNYFLLNLLLVVIIAFLGMRLHKVLTMHFDLPVKAAAASTRKIEKKPAVKAARTDSSIYNVITSQNLFHPSRSINKELPEVSRPPSKSELPQLFGTIIMNGKKLVILEDQSTKKSDLYEVNDSVSGFIVSQIREDKVILQKSGESIEVDLRADKEFRQPRRTQARQRAVRKAPKQRRRPGRVRRSRPPARKSSVR